MTNRDILNRELINHLFVRLFNQILDIEGRYMSGKGIEDLSLSELHIIDVISSLPNPAMSNIASKATLTNGKHGVTVGFEGYRWLAFWSKENAPFVCIEPWYSHTDFSEVKVPFEQREGTIILKSHDKFHADYTITIF